MQKILPILSIVTRILVIIVLASTALLSIMSAYIIFAPDTLPKPFYLQYAYPTQPEGAQVVVQPTATPEPKPGEGIMVDTGAKIINLADVSGKKLIRVTVVLEFEQPHVDSEAKSSGGHGEESVSASDLFAAEIESKKPLIDDGIVTLISTKTFDQLYTAAGKEQLRGELKELISQRLPEYHIISVYFTEFVVD